MKYAYPAIFTPEGNGLFNVDFPDLTGCYTCGDNLPDAMYMAQDALCLVLYGLEQDGNPIPTASNPLDIKTSFDQFSSVILADTEAYGRLLSRKAVKKTLTIPMWLNEKAEMAGVNFSGVLQSALKELLGVGE